LQKPRDIPALVDRHHQVVVVVHDAVRGDLPAAEIDRSEHVPKECRAVSVVDDDVALVVASTPNVMEPGALIARR
jgi:hypothetical protein